MWATPPQNGHGNNLYFVIIVRLFIVIKSDTIATFDSTFSRARELRYIAMFVFNMPAKTLSAHVVVPRRHVKNMLSV